MGDKKPMGGVAGAIAYFMKTLIVFIVIPLAIFYSLPYLFTAVGGVPDEMRQQVENLKPYIDTLVMWSIPLVVLSIPIGYFFRGDIWKVPFRIAYGVAAAWMIWMVTHGGRMSLSMKDASLGSVTVSSITIGVNNSILIMVTLTVCVLKGLLGIYEYYTYRDEFNGVGKE